MINKIYDKVINYIKENLLFLISLIFIVFIFNFELPYNVETPGGFISLNDRIQVENSNKSSGDLGMAYVSMLKGNIPFILLSYINGDWDIVEKNKLTYDNETIQEMNKREKLLLNEAIGSAMISSFKLANKPISIKEKQIIVSYNDNEKSSLEVGDIVLSINDKEVQSLKEIQDYLQTLNSNEIVKVKVRRNEIEEIKDVELKEYNGLKKLGVTISNNYVLESNPSVNINVKNNESGPSGGLMMALAIYDKISNSNLTKGDKIIGTGTIDEDGNVGEIGGVKYKLIGAVRKKAKVFLCPKENYEEALRVAKERNYDIIIKDVATLNDAINYLKER